MKEVPNEFTWPIKVVLYSAIAAGLLNTAMAVRSIQLIWGLHV